MRCESFSLKRIKRWTCVAWPFAGGSSFKKIRQFQRFTLFGLWSQSVYSYSKCRNECAEASSWLPNTHTLWKIRCTHFGSDSAATHKRDTGGSQATACVCGREANRCTLCISNAPLSQLQYVIKLCAAGSYYDVVAVALFVHLLHWCSSFALLLLSLLLLLLLFFAVDIVADFQSRNTLVDHSHTSQPHRRTAYTIVVVSLRANTHKIYLEKPGGRERERARIWGMYNHIWRMCCLS